MRKLLLFLACMSFSYMQTQDIRTSTLRRSGLLIPDAMDNTLRQKDFDSGSLGEDAVMTSATCVAGFALNNIDIGLKEHHGAILTSTSNSHDAGKGKAVGIYLNGADEATIQKNVVNRAYGNTTLNYRVNGTTWPILSLTSENISNPNIVNPLYNLEFTLVTPTI